MGAIVEEKAFVAELLIRSQNICRYIYLPVIPLSHNFKTEIMRKQNFSVMRFTRLLTDVCAGIMFITYACAMIVLSLVCVNV